MKKYKTPNGTILTINELIEEFGQEQFNLYLSNGELKLVDDDIYITPDGTELTSEELLTEFGQEQFNLYLSNGELKKKNQEEVGLPSELAPANLEIDEAYIQPTEKDYFEGTFGDILRGFDKIVPLGIGDFIDDTARAVASGYNQGVLSENAADLLVRGNMSSEEDLVSFIEANKNAQNLGPSDEMMDYQKTYEKWGGFLGVVIGIAKNPSVISELIVSSMTGMATNTDALLAGGGVISAGAGYGAAVGAAAGGVGAAPGALAGGLAAIPYAFATAGAVVEMGATFAELLQEEVGGVELTPENIKEVLNNEDKLSSIRNKAVARGITIGAIDALTGKLGSKIAGNIVTKGGKKAVKDATKKQVAKSILASSGVEAVGGSVGEATARAVIGQEMDISEIALEGIAEMPGGVKNYISARYSTPSYKVNGEKVNATTIDELINTMTLEQFQSSKIEIKNDYDGRKGKLQDRLIELSTKQEILAASPELNEPTVAELTKLQIELNNIEGNKTEIGKSRAAVLREQIAHLHWMAKYEEKVVVESTISEEQVERTAQALDAVDILDREKVLFSLFGSAVNDSKAVAEAYHADKTAGKETSLTKAVESLIPEEQVVSTTEVTEDLGTTFTQDGEFVTFEYDSKEDVPYVLRDRISTEGKINGKTKIRVTLPKVEADEILTSSDEAVVSLIPEEQVVPTTEVVEDTRIQELQTELAALKEIQQASGVKEVQVERTAQALDAVDILDREKVLFSLFGSAVNDSKAVAEAYHADKTAGKETSLTKAVESLIPEEQVVSLTPLLDRYEQRTSEIQTEIAALEQPVVETNAEKIERLRAEKQAELRKFETSEKETSKNNIKLLGTNEYVSRELMELAYSNDIGNNPKIGGGGQTLNRIIERGGYSKEELLQLLKPEITKINAKYDKAEIAALKETQQASGVKEDQILGKEQPEMFNATEEFNALEEEEQAKFLEASNLDRDAAIALFESEVKALEQELEGEVRFSVAEDGDALISVDATDSESIQEVMNNEFPESQVNFVSTPEAGSVTVSPFKESNSTEEFTDADAVEMGFESKEKAVQPIENFNNIPMLTAISDIAAGGTIKDSRGGDMKAKGGIMFNALAKVKAAWAGVKPSVSKGQYKNAVKLLNNNKPLFERLWKEGRLPYGQVPMAVIRMGNDAVNSNEIVFRYLSPEINAQSKENQTNAMSDLIKVLKIKEGENPPKLLKFISDNKISTLGALMDAIVADANARAKAKTKVELDKTLALDTRATLFKTMVSPEPEAGKPNPNPQKPFLKSLYKGSEGNFDLFTAQTIYKAIGEPSMMKSKKGDVVSIVGIDVLNGGVIDIDHGNYGTGPKGGLIALISNPTNGMSVFPEWKAKASRVFKENVSGKIPSKKSSDAQVGGTAANDKAFQGASVNTKMSDVDVLAAKFRFAFPGVTVVNTKAEYEAALKEPGVRTKISNGKTILGMTKDGKVFLNPDQASLGTPIHEFGHIWIDFLRSAASGDSGTALLNKGLKLVEGTNALKVAIEKYGDNKLAREEALVELMATKGETIIDAGTKSRFLDWLNATFKYIQKKFVTSERLLAKEEIQELKRKLNKGKITQKEFDSSLKKIQISVKNGIESLTLEDFINTGLADLFGGKELSASFDAKKESKGVMPRFELGDDVAAFIKQAKGQEISEAAIKTALRRRGVDMDVIASAIEKTKGAASVRSKVSEEFAQGYDRVMKEIDGIIEKSKKRGRTYSQIPKNVIAYLEGTKLYENATDVQRERMIRDIRKKFGIKEKSAPSVGRILGTIKDIKKITIAEKELYILRLKALNEGAKNATTAMASASKLLNEEIKEMKIKGTITLNQMTNVLSKFSKVNLLSEVSIERFVDYMANVFENAEYANIIATANAKRETAKSNASNKIGILQALSSDLQRIFYMKPSFIPMSVLDDYMSLIGTFGKKETVLSLPPLEEVTEMVNNILNTINEEQSLVPQLKELYDSYEKVTDKDGKVSYSSTIKAMFKDGTITESDYDIMKKYKSDIVAKEEKVKMSDEEIEAERKSIVSQIQEFLETSIIDLPTRLEREVAIELKKLSKTEAIDGLSLSDLKNLQKVFDNIDNGYLPHMAKVMTQKLNSKTEGKKLNSAVKRAKPAPVSMVYARIKNLMTKKGSIVEMIRRNHTFYIDQIFGDYKTKDIFNSILEKLAQKSERFLISFNVVQKKIEKAKQAVNKSFNRDGNQIKNSSYRQMAWKIQNEFITNPLSKQVNSVDKFLEATIKRIEEETSQFSLADAKLLQDILDTYYDKETGFFNNDELYESFNAAEKNSIKVLSEINQDLTERASFTKSVIRGDKFTPLNNNVHLNVLHEKDPSDAMSGPSAAAAFDNSVKVSTRAKNLTERTGSVNAINFDVYTSVLKGAKNTLLDFYLTSPIKTSRMTINEAKKNLKKGTKEIKIINSISKAFEESVENLLINSYEESSMGDAALEYLKKTGYRAILAGSGRFVAELKSNLSYAMFVDPKGFIAGTKIMKEMDAEMGPLILQHLNSKQSSRMYTDGLSGRMVETSMLSELSASKSKGVDGDVINFLRKYWNKSGQKYVKGVEFIADAMISTPDKLVMRPIWFGSFESKYKELTGSNPDRAKITANDEAYMQENQEALDEATRYADDASLKAGSTRNAFMGMLKGTSKPNQSTMVKVFNAFNGFMTGFLVNDYINVRTGLMNMVGSGNLEKRQGAALIAAVASRMMVYTLIVKYLSNALTDLFDDDEEEGDIIEEPKDFYQELGQAFASTFSSLLFGRDFGNATKSFINLGLEEFNKRQLDFLRNGEYDPYKDAIQYTINPKQQNSGGSGLADYIMLMGAAYGPAIKTLDLVVKKATEPVKKTEEARKRQQDEIYKRIPLEIFGNLGFIPLYKDVRKVVLDGIYKDLRVAQAELKDAKRVKEEMLQGYDSETDMKRYNPVLWENTFGPNSEGYDARQAEKELKKAERKLKQQLKDELYNYTPEENIWKNQWDTKKEDKREDEKNIWKDQW